MLMIHLFLLVAKEYSGAVGTGNGIVHDNISAIYTFHHKSKRISSGAKRWCQICSTKGPKQAEEPTLASSSQSQLGQPYPPFAPIPWGGNQLFNCLCDDLAKVAIVEGVLNGVDTGQQLHLEMSCVYIRDDKQTTDLTKGLRYAIRKARARKFYAKRDIFDAYMLDSGAWEDPHKMLQQKPKIYQFWFVRKGSDHCSMRVMLAQWDKSEKTTCSNCNGKNKDANHLNRCPDLE